jgi:hypothetical protein
MGITDQMGKADLVFVGVIRLRDEAIGEPHLRSHPTEELYRHDLAAGRRDHVSDGRRCAEYPLPVCPTLNAVLCAAGGWSLLLCRRMTLNCRSLSFVPRSAHGTCGSCRRQSHQRTGIWRQAATQRRLHRGSQRSCHVRADTDAFRYIRAFWPAYIQERKTSGRN